MCHPRSEGAGRSGLLAALACLATLAAGTVRADDACTASGGGEAAGCQIQKQPPINFGTLKSHYHTFSCTGTNLLFLGNDEGYPGTFGFDFDNSCFTVWPQGQTFDADLNVLVTNWCDKPETLNVALGCMPGN